MATRQGLQAKSFALAAEAYSDAVGAAMSPDSLRRVTEGWGQAVEAQRVLEAQQVFEAEGMNPGGAPLTLKVRNPISGPANLSTDGGMILLRQEGWKEVKLSVISQVERKADERNGEIRVVLKRHSSPVRRTHQTTFRGMGAGLFLGAARWVNQAVRALNRRW